MNQSKGKPIEFGHYPEGTIPDVLFDKAAEDISNYLVSFAVEDRPSGSATLVTLDGKHGFLTAAHVVDDLLKSPGTHIAVICARQLHRLLLDKNHIEIIKHGPSKGDFGGPDLAFINVLDSACIGTLKAKKSFYPFTNPTATNWDKIMPKESTICFIAGAPAEMASESGVRRTESHILCSSHFIGRAQLSGEFQCEGFHYLKFSSIAGQHGFPENFGGVSGGGVWHVPFAMNPDQGLGSLTFLKPELIGMAFWQYAPCGNSREILAHGYTSAYAALSKR